MPETDGRYMTTYQCRITPKLKRVLLQTAAAEHRTANKIVNDALYIYLGMTKEERKAAKKVGVKTVDAEGFLT